MILHSKPLAKVSGGSSGPPVTPTPDQQKRASHAHAQAWLSRHGSLETDSAPAARWQNEEAAALSYTYTVRRQRQRRTEGDARPQKEGGIPEAEMIAKVSSGSSAKSHTQGRQGTRAEGAAAGPTGPAGGSISGCLGVDTLGCLDVDVWLTAEGSGMQEDIHGAAQHGARVRSATTGGSTRAC